MKFYSILLAFSIFALPHFCTAQKSNSDAHCMNKKFNKRVNQLLRFSVPTIDVDDLKKVQKEVHIFDTREMAEYKVSHIEGAQYLGYDDFDASRIGALDKDAKIVVYCSVGYRSEKIGDKLKKLGYTNVRNLYGSIFEWINRGYPVVDSNNKITKKVHTYNKKWSQWVEESKADKTW